MLPRVSPENNHYCLFFVNFSIGSPVDKGLVDESGEIAGGEDENVGELLDGVELGQQRVHHPQGVRAFEGGAGVLPGAGQGLHLVDQDDDEGGGVGKLLLHVVEEPLDQLATLAHPLDRTIT